MRARICGKVWDVVDDPTLRGEDGLCEAPHTPRKRIRLRPGIRGARLVETVIHEGLHAADWSKDEEWVAEAAHDLTRLLLRVLAERGERVG